MVGRVRRTEGTVLLKIYSNCARSFAREVGPYVLGFLLFVVVGSAVFQIMEATQKSNSFG